VQTLNDKPNLVLALGAVDVYVDTRQPLDIVLKESEETVRSDGSGWFAAQSSRLLRELDEREKAISFDVHVVSHVIGWAFHAVALLPAARIPRQ